MVSARQVFWFRLAVCTALVAKGVLGSTLPSEGPLSPCALAATKDHRTIFIACSTDCRVLRFDLAEKKVTASFAMPNPPSGLALSPDNLFLYITCAAPESKLCVIDLAKGSICRTLAAGHTAMAPVLSLDGQMLFFCNRFNNNISMLDTTTGKELCRIPVQREPVAADVTKDGKHLLVANLLHTGAADEAHVAAVVSVIDVQARKVVKELLLPDGSGVLNDIRVSPDGKFACVTHLLSRFRMPATQVDRGWMNNNALTILDLSTMEVLNTVLLDNVDRGAANPWGIGWSQDGTMLVIAHAGTHEVSCIDFPALLARLLKLGAAMNGSQPAEGNYLSRVQGDVPKDLAFLLGIRRRVKLPEDDLGPRAVAVVDDRV